MDEKQLIKDKEFISKLCVAIEKRLGRKFSSPRDFDFLSEELSKYGKRISSSTLKRIWGYNHDISDTYSPYQYTIVSLINVLGFKSIDDYVEHYRSEEIQSAKFVGETITVEHIMPGSIIELSWAPNRICNLICREEGVFQVAHSEHGRLFPGDIVKFKSLTQNAPLYFNEVFRPSTKEIFVYTAGNRTGIHYHVRGIVNSGDETVIS